MRIISTVNARNGHILCEKVKYGDVNKYDPQDQSNIWYRVIKTSFKKPSFFQRLFGIKNTNAIETGDLCRFPPRQVSEQVIENVPYYQFNESQVSLIIKHTNVKKDLFRG